MPIQRTKANPTRFTVAHVYEETREQLRELSRLVNEPQAAILKRLVETELARVQREEVRLVPVTAE